MKETWNMIKFAWRVAGFPVPFFSRRKTWSGIRKQRNLHGNGFVQNYCRPFLNFCSQLRTTWGLANAKPPGFLPHGDEFPWGKAYENHHASLHAQITDTEAALDKIATEKGFRK
jgi:hypothetical protein